MELPGRFAAAEAALQSVRIILGRIERFELEAAPDASQDDVGKEEPHPPGVDADEPLEQLEERVRGRGDPAPPERRDHVAELQVEGAEARAAQRPAVLGLDLGGRP